MRKQIIYWNNKLINIIVSSTNLESAVFCFLRFNQFKLGRK